MAPRLGAVLDIGVGARELIGSRGAGTVIACYAKAVYVRCAGGVLALTTPAVPPGPIHVRCHALPAYELGRPVSMGDLDVDAPTWRGTLPEPAQLVAAADFALSLLEPVAPAVLLEGPLPAAWAGHADVLRAGDLHRAAETLGGRGMGLTQAGDDVIAGLVLAAAAMWGRDSRAELARAVAASRTNDIAAGFLRWAGLGQSIAPVHDFLHAVSRFDARGARSALARLRSFGASSGSDLAYGLALALRHLPRSHPGKGQTEPSTTQSTRAALRP
jgi:hypothetical protein